jgi:hypothetical protein
MRSASSSFWETDHFLNIDSVSDPPEHRAVAGKQEGGVKP